jgi:hypothetical protein
MEHAKVMERQPVTHDCASSYARPNLARKMIAKDGGNGELGWFVCERIYER